MNKVNLIYIASNFFLLTACLFFENFIYDKFNKLIYFNSVINFFSSNFCIILYKSILPIFFISKAIIKLYVFDLLLNKFIIKNLYQHNLKKIKFLNFFIYKILN